jgi:hypothetical protein
VDRVRGLEMSSFRIVRRVELQAPRYYAQRKWLLWWIDCEHVSTSGGETRPEGAENPSRRLELVRNYIDHVVNKVVYEDR